MPLFDTIERDVSSFFVAQGSIFDTILKTVLERITHVEARVDHSALVLNAIQQNIKSGSVGGGTSAGNDELEYFVMALARQLNVVLALLFQPLSQTDAMAQAHARQQQMPSISDVLTDNESMLMGLAAVPASEPSPAHVTDPTPTIPGSPQILAIGSDPAQVTATPVDASPDQATTPPTESPAPGIPFDLPDTDNKPDTGNAPVASDAVDSEGPPSDHDQASSLPHTSRGCKLSTFAMIHHLHSANERRHHHENELLQRMKRLLNESQTQCIQRHTQLEQQNQKLRTEWAYQQEQQAAMALHVAQLEAKQQQEIDRQLQTMTNTFLVSQTTQEQQMARLVEKMGDFLSKTDSTQLLTCWLQRARDDCIYGANGETLAKLQVDLVEFQRHLTGEPASQVVVQLLDETGQALDVLGKLSALLAQDDDALHGPQGVQLMQTLRGLVPQIEELASTMNTHKNGTKTTAFLSDFTRQMELGTAHLLDEIEKQQERYQQTLLQQQAELELLKVDVRTQKLSDDQLRKQLESCPSQEDTLQLIAALQQQINASTSDSASRMLNTVDDLRNKMAGLPTHEFLDELLHSKADRSEIDRIRLLLAASSNGNGPSGPSLSKSPTRCLSCDQSLPFMHSRPESASDHHSHSHSQSHSERPSTGGNARPLSSSSTGSRSSSPNHRHTLQPTSHPHNHHNPYDQSTSCIEEEDQQQQHQPQHAQERNRGYTSPFTRAMLLLSDQGGGGSTTSGLPSTQEILRDLATTIESSKRRRQRLQDQHDQLEEDSDKHPTRQRKSALSAAAPTFGTPEADGKNRIPLRRTTLSDQVVYGPSITTGLLKPKKSISGSSTLTSRAGGALGSARGESNDSSKTFRPKTAIPPDRRATMTATGGGDVIVRTKSTTVVIRPFSEHLSRPEDKTTGSRG